MMLVSQSFFNLIRLHFIVFYQTPGLRIHVGLATTGHIGSQAASSRRIFSVHQDPSI